MLDCCICGGGNVGSGYCLVVVVFEFEFIKIYLNGKYTKFEKLKFTVYRIYVNVYALI